jgi:hypothetical protein
MISIHKTFVFDKPSTLFYYNNVERISTILFSSTYSTDKRGEI